MKYVVTFTKYYSYDIEAENCEEAKDKAYKEFASDMTKPSTNVVYDEVDIEEADEDDDTI